MYNIWNKFKYHISLVCVPPIDMLITQVPSVVAFVHPSSSVFVQSTFEPMKPKQIHNFKCATLHYLHPAIVLKNHEEPSRAGTYTIERTMWLLLLVHNCVVSDSPGRLRQKMVKCQAKTVTMSWQNVKTSIHSAHSCKQAVGSLSNKKLWLVCTCHHRFHSQERLAREALKLRPWYQHSSNRLGFGKTQKPPKGKRYSLHGRPGGGQYHRCLWAVQIALWEWRNMKKWFLLGGQANSRPIL